MVIAVNTRLLLKDRLEGMGRFMDETLKILTREHQEHQFVFIFDRKHDESFIYSQNILPVIGFPQARHPLLWYVFFERSIPVLLRKYKADLFLSPDGWLSLKTPVKSLPIIHDLNFFHFPEFIPWHLRSYYHYFFPRFIRKACRIATVSEFSKNDIRSHFNVPHENIDVVYNGADHSFRPLTGSEHADVRGKFTRGCPYFLFVGLIHPRKNLDGLFKAFDGFKKEINSNVKLVIAGSRKWWTEDMENSLKSADFKDEIVFTGRLPDEDLKMIMGSAIALVYASHFEGFGIPILEAMYCDTPVITSNVSSMPEVGGDAVLYVDPSSAESIKSAMLSVFCDRTIRNNLIEKARKRRESFSWERTAELLWDSISHCI